MAQTLAIDESSHTRLKATAEPHYDGYFGIKTDPCVRFKLMEMNLRT